MNEELQENAKETESEMREEIDMSNVRVLEVRLSWQIHFLVPSHW